MPLTPARCLSLRAVFADEPRIKLRSYGWPQPKNTSSIRCTIEASHDKDTLCHVSTVMWRLRFWLLPLR